MLLGSPKRLLESKAGVTGLLFSFHTELSSCCLSGDIRETIGDSNYF
jgi:hypothetical protein